MSVCLSDRLSVCVCPSCCKYMFIMKLVLGNTTRVSVCVSLCVCARLKLLCADQAGIVHRGLKPDNVLVSAEGHSVLSDFETRPRGTHTHTHTRAHIRAHTRTRRPSRDYETVTRVVVSGVYTAPEVLMAGGEHSRASDMFSFGALLAQALTGDFSARPDALLPRLGDACGSHAYP